MNNNLLRIKVQERLNKLASFDYDNIECWQIAEAFNKAQREWFYRQMKGLNLRKEGPEASIVAIDDLQKFLVEKEIQGTNKKMFFETVALPDNYAHYVRMSAKGDDDRCKDRDFTIYLTEEANVGNLLNDVLKEPNFEWAETFCTLVNDHVRIYTEDKFKIHDVSLIYFRKPLDISFEGCISPADGSYQSNVESEFKDEVVEVLVDEAVAILAGDIESMNQYQKNLGNAQRNT